MYQDELKDRKKVGTMIAEFLSAQKDLLAQVDLTFLLQIIFLLLVLLVLLLPRRRRGWSSTRTRWTNTRG